MAGDWIQIDHDWPEKPETLAIFSATCCPIGEILLRLFKFWRAADRQTTDGILRGVTVAGLCELAGGDVAFWEAVKGQEWLGVTNEGWVCVPGFRQRFSRPARKRILAAKRMRRMRQRNASGNVQENGQGNGKRNTARNGKVTNSNGQALHVAPPEPEPESTSEIQGEERSGEDLVLTSVSKEGWERAFDWEAVRAFCQRKFLPERHAVFQPPLGERDRTTLLKIGALYVAGRLGESRIDSALEAIRHHTGRPIQDRVGYLLRVIRAEAERDGFDLYQRLAEVRVPSAVVTRKG